MTDDGATTPNGGKPMVTITRKEHEALLQDQAMLAALESAGVDNWEGYDHAMDILRMREQEGE